MPKSMYCGYIDVALGDKCTFYSKLENSPSWNIPKTRDEQLTPEAKEWKTVMHANDANVEAAEKALRNQYT